MILWNDGGHVVALTPPGGMTAEAAQAAYAPSPSWIVDNATLPDVPIEAWVLADGVVTVDQATVDALGIPRSITNAQLKRQLAADSKLSAAKTAVEAADGLAQALWYGAATFERTDPLLVGLATALGYDTDAKLDAFFVAAAKL